MRSKLNPIFALEHFTPSLREAFANSTLSPDTVLRVAISIEDPETQRKPVPKFVENGWMMIAWGDEHVSWAPPSLEALFRGDLQPPEFGTYPDNYEDAFLVLDLHALEYGTLIGDPTDQEMREVYSDLRRRPDGRRRSPLHEYMWRAAALMVGTRPISRAEFEGIMSRLERSCRTFSIGPVSRNYLDTLHKTLGNSGQRPR
ncbi:MAG: hypothetical protein KF833_09030 [Verrucomicrobiae bacterium]|nr:hypothetical protein [Verrucomicrobiae bacterium]